jgi:aminoglycoside phosphotransferase family enzyme/predicted kinase
MRVASGAAPDLIVPGEARRALRETHISWVVLAGERAFKVKKPVVLPFLDYGTPARRRAMSHAEVELNRRLAPDLYRGVRSLVPDASGALRVSDEDDPTAVDYAVEMRRYAEDATLAARLAAGTAGRVEVAALGERLARFHAEAPAVRPDHGAEAVKRALDDTFATLRALVSGSDARAAVARAERFAAATLTAAWQELDDRAARGRVRDGHGDLRLEHVLLERTVEVVDCVEFDPALRQIDVAADLAFLVMELHEIGRPELARVLVGAYRAAGGDPGNDALLAFFAAYRAQVRAKVALLRAGQDAPESVTARGQVAHEETLLALGERLQWAARTPLVLVVAGLAATGKSTLAGAVAAVSGYSHLNSDIVRKERAGLAPAERAPLALYTAEANRATYAELGRRASAAAGAGVIVDATFRRREDREAFRARLAADLPVLVVECQAPAAVLEERARARARDPGSVSDAGEDVVRRQRRDADPLDELPPDRHLRLRTDRAVEQTVAEVADALDRMLLSRHPWSSTVGSAALDR